MYGVLIGFLLTFVAGVSTAQACPADARCSYGMAMFSESDADLKYHSNFTHFEYVNPDAPKGGAVKELAIGTFDSLNPYVLKGVSAAGLGMIYDTLMQSSADEPFSKYGLIAQEVQLANDNSYVAFVLNPAARWQDGVAITAEDVVFTFNALMKYGHPSYRTYYRDVEKVEADGDHRVKFTFKTKENRELAFILGELSILPKHAYHLPDDAVAGDKTLDFTAATLDVPLGSGPYKVDAVDAGKSIRYARVDDYWAKDLPVNKGRYNFDTITYEYYRDDTVAVEAFKAGQYDIRQENIAKNWATAYDIPQIRDGKIIKDEMKHELPTGMQAYVFNTRRAQFADSRVRQALAYAFDFEWTNKQLFYGSYMRTDSFFSNSVFASSGVPDGDELALLEPFRDQLPAEVFTTEYAPPMTDGSGNIRDNLLKAQDLLKQAGWEVKAGKLLNAEGQQMQLEVLLSSPNIERVTGPMLNNMKRLGIDARMRTVDSAQYIKRLESFDFDMIMNVWGESLSPGNEQKNYWHSESADVNGSQNYAGIKNPVVDALVEKVVTAKTKDEVIAATRALDRVLLWGHYVIPNWYLGAYRVLYWNKFGQPDIRPTYGLGFDTWWIL